MQFTVYAQSFQSLAVCGDESLDIDARRCIAGEMQLDELEITGKVVERFDKRCRICGEMWIQMEFFDSHRDLSERSQGSKGSKSGD